MTKNKNKKSSEAAKQEAFKLSDGICYCKTPEERKEMLQDSHKRMVECLIKRDVKNGQKALMQHFDMIDQIIHSEMEI